ncbi:MAG: hypothetical protein KDD63_17300, partial [Bacteroidetes bacterium]|nr:hypothetical protein [Bacteroidota bacterium]
MIDKDILLDLQRILEKESELRPTEVLVGFTVYPYPFSVAYYEATVTEAIELNTFDLAICGLLAIQEGLSREEIGQILGFQVIDNPEKQMYKDPAEFNILQFALKDL